VAFTPKNVDDRSFEDLVAEARRRIPAYLPEWTDHNESDPGIALVQLFSWLAETTLFRLNQLPDERMYVSFLNLVGLAPAPAVSARAIVEIKVTPGSGGHMLAASELRLTAPGETDEVPFEADSSVSLVGTSIGALVVDDGISLQRRDVTSANQAGNAAFQPFGPTRIAGRALYVGLDATPPAGPPLLLPPDSSAVLQLYAAAEEKAAEVVPASTWFGTAASSLEGDVVWEGKTAADTWTRLELLDDETRGLARTGFLRLRLTGSLIASKEPGDPQAKERFWLRAVASDTQRSDTRSLRYLIPNAVRVRQWRTYARELLAPGSDGTPNQQRDVRHPPILLGSPDAVLVEVNEQQPNGNLEWTAWAQAEDLATRRQGDSVATAGHPLSVFSVSRDRSSVVFGDGLDGRVPPRGPNNLRVTYRSGGGANGNVSAGSLSLASSPTAVEGVEQREGATGGSDEENVERARDTAPQRLRTLERAVTAADFEVLAREHAGVGRASALNRYNPRVPGAPVTGAITLVVVPPRQASETAPAPGQLFLDGVARILEPYRVLTTELFVVGPRYRRVKVEVEIEVRNAADAAEARTAVVQRLNRFFDPIDGGSDAAGWPLGSTISYGEVLSNVLGAPRVSSVRSLRIWLDGAAQPVCSDVPLGSSIDLLASELHGVRVRAPEVGR